MRARVNLDSSLSVPAVKCPFLQENEEEKLVTVCCNNLALGQFELGRVALLQLAELSPNKALALLRMLIYSGPPLPWLKSESVLSSPHFIWLCWTEYMSLSQGKELPPTWLTERVEFELLLACIEHPTAIGDHAAAAGVQGRFSEKQRRSIRSYWYSLQAMRSPGAPMHAVGLAHLFSLREHGSYALSSEALAGLRHVFRLYPLLGHALCTELVSLGTEGQRHNTEKLVQLVVQIVGEALFSQRYAESVSFLRFLARYPGMRLTLLRKLFMLLIPLSQERFRSDEWSEARDRAWQRDVGALDPRSIFEMRGEIDAPRNKRTRELDIAKRMLERKRQSHAPVIAKTDIYQSLLAMDSALSPLALFCELEDDDVRQQSLDTRLPAPFKFLYDRVTAADLSGDAQATAAEAAQHRANLADFWRDWFTFLRVTGHHTAEYVLDKGLQFIKAQAFVDAFQLMQPFAPLRPLLLTLSWDHFGGDISSQQKVMDTLWDSMAQEQAGGDPQINQVCSQLKFRLELSWWYAERFIQQQQQQQQKQQQHDEHHARKKKKKGAKAKPHLPVDAAAAEDAKTGVANQVLLELRHKSILLVMRPRLATLQPGETLQLLQARPAETEALREEKELDVVIMRGYVLIRKLTELFDKRARGESISDAHLDATVRAASQHLLSMRASEFRVVRVLWYRVMLLENVMSLVFLESRQWKPQADQPAAPAAPAEQLSSSSIKNVAAVGAQVGATSDLFPFAYSFVHVAPGVFGHREWTRSPFVANKALLRALLTLVNTAMPSPDELRGADATLLWHVERLRTYVREAEWRLQLLEPLETHLRCLHDSHFMPRMLASPETLLSLCMKTNDFARCKDVIAFFRMSQSHANVVSLAEQLNELRAQFEHKTHTIDLDPVLGGASVYEDAFLICTDLAVSIAKVPSHCSDLLDLASQYLTRFVPPNELSSFSSAMSRFSLLSSFTMTTQPQEGEHQTTTLSLVTLRRFANLLRRLRLLANAFPHQSLRALLAIYETLPPDSTLLEQALSRRRAQLKALGSLIGTLEKLRHGEKPKLDAFLRNLIRTFADEARRRGDYGIGLIGSSLGLLGGAVGAAGSPGGAVGGTSGVVTTTSAGTGSAGGKKKKKGTGGGGEDDASDADEDGAGEDEDEAVTQYLSQVLDFVVEMGDILRSAEDEDAYNHFSNLGVGAKKIIARLVFERKMYGKADRLSTLMQHDVVGVTLRSTQAHPQDKWAALGGIAPDEANKHTGLHFPLTMDVVRFIEPYSALMASLACIVRSPPAQLNGVFWDYALAHSKVFPALQRWVCLKALSYAHLVTVFLAPTAAELEANSKDDGGLSHASGRAPSRYIEEFSFDWDDHGAKLDSDTQASLFSAAATNAWFEPTFSEFPDMPRGWDSVASYVPPDGRELVEEELECLDMIHTEDGSGDGMLYERVVRQLMDAGELDRALSVADQMLPAGAPDELLISLVEKAEDRTIVWRYIRRIREKPKAAQLTLKYLRSWDVDTGIDLMFMCECHLSDDDQERADVRDMGTRLKTLRSVMLVDRSWDAWQAVADMCQQDCGQVVRRLVDMRSYDLARQVVELWDAPQHLRNEIEERYLMDLLTEKHDRGTSLVVLTSLGEHALPICESLQTLLHADYSNRLFVVQFLLHNLRAVLTHEAVSRMTVQELGLQVMVRLPESMHARYCALVEQPSVMVENLLMAQHTSLVHALFRALPQLQDDALCITYARKGLAFPAHMLLADVAGDVAAAAAAAATSLPDAVDVAAVVEWTLERGDGVLFPCPATHDGIPFATRPSQEFWLCGDEQVDTAVRQQHAFRQAPSFTLAKAFLDLCEDVQQAGNACLRFADQLAKFLVSPKQAPWHLLVTNTIHKLLRYARGKFEDVADGFGRVALCESFLNATEFLLALRHSDSGMQVPLNDVLDHERACELRDRLVRDDRVELAVHLCRIASVDSTSVWLAWGTHLVRLGMEEDAREKFVEALRAATLVGVRAVHAAVDRILAVLEEGPPTRLALVHKAYNNLIHRDTSRTTGMFDTYLDATRHPSPVRERPGAELSSFVRMGERVTRRSNLDKQRYALCLHFVTTWGSQRQRLAFFVRHGQLFEACQYALEPANKVSMQLFVEEVIEYAVAHDAGFNELRQALQKIDPLVDKPITRDAGKWIIKFLSNRKAYSLQYTMHCVLKQDLMAGVVSAWMYSHVSEDRESGIRYLDRSIAHLQEGLQTLSRDPNAAAAQAVDESMANRYLAAAQLQLRLIREVYRHTDGRVPNLFDTTECAEEAERLLASDEWFLFAVDVAREFRHSFVKVACNVVKRLATPDTVDRLFTFLNRVKMQQMHRVTEQEKDKVVVAGVDALVAAQMVDTQAGKRHLDEAIELITDPRTRVSKLCNLGRLKTAAHLATSINSVPLVRYVLSEAQKAGSSFVVAKCVKFLEGSKK